MPWDTKSAKKHNKNADSTWVKIANGALKSGHDDASAIRIANAAKKKLQEKVNR